MPRTFLAIALSCAISFGVAAQGNCAQAKKSKSGKTATAAVVAPSLQVNLVKIHGTAARVVRATLEVINDVGQRQMAVETGDPRMFSPSNYQVEKNPKLWEKEWAMLGPLEPPHKAWLDTDVSHVKRWVDLLSSEMQAISDADKQWLGQSYTDMNAAYTDLNNSYNNMLQLCAGPPYDNLKIASAALKVRDDATKIQDIARKAAP